jgi:hypothetical protein
MHRHTYVVLGGISRHQSKCLEQVYSFHKLKRVPNITVHISLSEDSLTWTIAAGGDFDAETDDSDLTLFPQELLSVSTPFFVTTGHRFG